MMALTVHPLAARGPDSGESVPFLAARGPGVDYYQFWIVGRARSGSQPLDIYSARDRLRMADLGRALARSAQPPSERLTDCARARGPMLHTFSTPWLYAAVNALAPADYDRAYDRFTDVCLGALVFAVPAMGLLLGYSAAEALLFASAVLFWSEPVTSDLRVGNVNELQLAGVALFLLACRGRGDRPWTDLAAGIVLGLLVAFKPTLATVPFLLAVSWAIDRRWGTLLRRGAGAVAGAGLAFCAGCWFLGSPAAWWDWGKALSGLDTVSDVSVQAGNYSLARVISEAVGGPAGRGADSAPVLVAAAAVLTGVALARTRPAAGTAGRGRAARFERDFLVTALSCALSVVSLPLVWLHYYVLLVPLLLYVLRPGGWLRPGGGGPSRVLVPAAGLALAWLALAAVFGRPLTVLLDPTVAVGRGLYIGGAWGLSLLGIAALWFPGRELASARETA
jgi:hypothetical protein